MVIPAYNRAATIGAAIDSVLRQTWTDFELVVVDDGSTDGTLAAARAVADPRLRVVAAPRNLGAAGARNLGVAEARGTWIAFQDSDDEWLPEKLARQMARLATPARRRRRRLGRLLLRPPDRRRARRPPGRAHHAPLRARPVGEAGGGRHPRAAARAQHDHTQTLVVRRDVFLALGRFDEATTPIEDWDFALRLAHRGPIAFVDEPLVHQRFSPNSITRGTRRRRESQERLVTKNMALFAGRPHLLARQYYILAERQPEGGRPRRGAALSRARPEDASRQPAPLGDVALRGRPQPARPVPRPPGPDQPAR